MANTPSEGKLDKRITAVGVIGFLGLAGVFFLLGLFCIGPWFKTHFGSGRQGPKTVYNPPVHRQPRPTVRPQAEDQQQLDIEITEQASEDVAAADQGAEGEVNPDNNTITFHLDSETESQPSQPAEPEKPKKPAVRKEEPRKQAARIEKPRAASETVRSSVPSDRVYRVQAGTFASRTNAETLRDDLQAKGYHPEIKSVQTQGRTLYRVQLGGYRTQEDADELAKDLSGDGYAPTTVIEKAE